MSRRTAIIGASLFAAAVAVVLVIALGGNEEERAETAPHGPPTTGVTETTDTARTQTAEPLTDTATTPEPDPRAAEVERAVFALVEATEVGKSTPAGVDVSALPTSDELSVERTEVAGERATVTLAGGVKVRLQRSGGDWEVVAVQGGR